MSTQRQILGMRVNATSYQDATDTIMRWAAGRERRSVCVANVHMVMESWDNPAFKAVVNGADLVTPDGMPLVWALRLLGLKGQQRVYGPDLVLHICRAAAEQGIPIALYGGTPESLQVLTERLTAEMPKLSIAAQIAPPFRPLTQAEDEAYVDQLARSGARIVLVGIGCPKQERWMAEHRNLIPAVLVGVGAAFDFHAGRVRQAPGWMQRSGLEWLFRLLMEPRRLWKRYAKHNPRFVGLFLLQLLGILRSKEA